MKIRRFLLFLGIIFLLIFIFGVYEKFSKKTYQKIKERGVKIVVYASGYVKPKEYLIVKAETSGYIKNLFVKEGDFVKKGEKLAEIEVKGLFPKIQEIEKELSLVEERLKEHSEFQEILRKEIEIAKTNFQQEEKRFLRRKELFQEGLIAKENLEETEKSYKNAKEYYEKLKNNYEDILKELRTRRLILLQQKRTLQEELSKYTVLAPISGYILKRYVERGDYLFPGESKLFSLGTKEFEILLEVDEEYANLIREKQKVFLSFDTYPTQLFEGEIFQIIKEVDRSKRNFIVKAQTKTFIEVPAFTTVEANILIGEKKIVALPQKALIYGNFVEVKGKGRVKVEIGEQFEEYIEVISGVSPGEEVRVFE